MQTFKERIGELTTCNGCEQSAFVKAEKRIWQANKRTKNRAWVYLFGVLGAIALCTGWCFVLLGSRWLPCLALCLCGLATLVPSICFPKWPASKRQKARKRK